MRFRTIIFDLDGTLIDHFQAIYRSHAHTMARLGLPAPSYAQVRAAVGGGLEKAIAHLAGPTRVAEALPIFRAYWDATLLDDVILLPGAHELLLSLHTRGISTAVLTNKLGASARLICDHLALTPLLATIVGATDTAWLKPDPALPQYVLAQLGADAADALMVGDSPYDVQTAHQSALPCWCVTTGTHTAEELTLAGADSVYAGLDEIGAVLA